MSLWPKWPISTSVWTLYTPSYSFHHFSNHPINTFSSRSQGTLTCFIYLYSYLKPCHLISSSHFLSPLVRSASHRKCRALPPPLSLPLISHFCHTYKLCAVSLTHREELWFIPRLQQVILPVRLFFLWCTAHDPSVSHLQPTLYQHCSHNMSIRKFSEYCVCVCVRVCVFVCVCVESSCALLMWDIISWA